MLIDPTTIDFKGRDPDILYYLTGGSEPLPWKVWEKDVLRVGDTKNPEI